jgi:hypothetical protein
MLYSGGSPFVSDEEYAHGISPFHWLPICSDSTIETEQNKETGGSRFSPVPLTVEEIAEEGEKGFILTDQKASCSCCQRGRKVLRC